MYDISLSLSLLLSCPRTSPSERETAGAAAATGEV
jgi:hypothetical protein